jgi:hypothetical protein
MCAIWHIAGASEYGVVHHARLHALTFDVSRQWGRESMISLGWVIIGACAIGLGLSALAQARSRRRN